MKAAAMLPAKDTTLIRKKLTRRATKEEE